MSKFRARLPLYIRLAWGAFITFGLVGTCAKPSQLAPPAIIILVSLAWVMLKIMAEATEAWIVIQAAALHSKKTKGGDPPNPT